MAGNISACVVDAAVETGLTISLSSPDNAGASTRAQSASSVLVLEYKKHFSFFDKPRKSLELVRPEELPVPGTLASNEICRGSRRLEVAIDLPGPVKLPVCFLVLPQLAKG